MVIKNTVTNSGTKSTEISALIIVIGTYAYQCNVHVKFVELILTGLLS